MGEGITIIMTIFDPYDAMRKICGQNFPEKLRKTEILLVSKLYEASFFGTPSYSFGALMGS